VLLVCLGNEIIHQMTAHRRQNLRVDLGDWNGDKRFAKFNYFKVEGETKDYKLSAIGMYTGSAGIFLIFGLNE